MSSHFTAEVAFRSPFQPQRRQNTSCDPCRRSKRRCFFPVDEPDSSTGICAHCRRLGHACTFDFAASQQNLRPKKRQRRNPPRSNQNADQSDTCSLDGSFNMLGGLAERTPQTGSVDVQDDLAAWLNFDIEHLFNDNVALPLTGELNASEHHPSFPGSTKGLEAGKERQLALLPDRPPGMQTSQYRADAIFGSTIRSPVHLLNSKIDARMLDDRSIRILDTIVTGSANRFLDYECNLYATGTRYQIENSSSHSSQGSTPAGWNVLMGVTTTESPITSPESAQASLIPTQDPREAMTRALVPPQDDDLKMTLLGCARFLDHFGDIYGNRLSSNDRKRSDAALKTVVRAFSLQWLPKEKVREGQSIRNSSLDVYTDAWHQARASLNGAHSVRSFRVVFACFMFDGIVMPTSARSHAIAHEFLDIGLQKLHDLDGLVKQFCTTLGPFSKYAIRIEASLAIVHWCGYLRDTGAALFGDHQCNLSYPLAHKNAFTDDDSTPPRPVYSNVRELDLSIPAICRKASAKAFSIWGQMINIKRLLLKTPDSAFSPLSERFDLISDTLAAIGRFDGSFRHFLNNCRESFHDLSVPSRIASVSLMAFWDLGILTFVEVIQALQDNAISDLSPEIQAYRQNATFSIAAIIECVLRLPVDEAFNLQNGLSADVPLIAYHVTLSLMATALDKAVEHIIDMRTSCRYNDESVGTTWTTGDETWTRQIDFLMKGLLSLDVTVGGSQTAGVSFQSLMRNHGDIISECWTSEFET